VPIRNHKSDREEMNPQEKQKLRRAKRIEQHLRKDRLNMDPFLDQNGKESPHMRKG